MTYRDIINDAEKLLIKNSIDDAEYDAKQILLTLLDMDMSEYLLMEDRDLEEIFDVATISDIANKFDELINLRCNHYPLQYILGEQYFYGLRFQVSEDVLIPRQDTEVLVEKVLEDNIDKNISILDMCTGSGCIAITLASLGGYKTIVASDISRDALEVASQNADEILNISNEYNDEMNQHIYFVLSDMFNDIDKVKEKTGNDKYDVITINPPYIRTNDMFDLQEEVRRYEPHIALDGGNDGLKYYKTIAKDVKNYLNDGGKLYMEIGYDQGDAVKKIFEKEGYTNIEIVKDNEGRDRAVVVRNNENT